MKLYKLLKGIKCRVLGSMLIDVKGLYHNDKQVCDGGMFFCLSGTNDQGLKYVSSAIESGAVVVVSEKEIQGLHNVTQVLVKNVRKAMSLISKNYYENPAKNLKLIGVTGTNGKTSTTYMISNMLESLGFSSAIIGTNGVIYNGKIVETGMTTPDPIELQKILYSLSKSGVKYVCMEVSAHAIFYSKIEGLVFDVIIFSNLTEDHLDFFGNMEDYFQTKRKLFSKKYAKTAIINIDDKYGQRLIKSINMQSKTYSIYNKSDYHASNGGVKNFRQYINLAGQNIDSGLLGEFNIYNLTSAIACIDVLGLGISNLQKLISEIKEIPGRFNTRVIKQKLFIVDYAHTPDGLENVLKLCKSLALDKKIICLFGCGGNRETQKREKMGEISSKYADFTIITTDNPRFEDKLKIAKEIEKGAMHGAYKIVLDRVKSIKFADKISNEGDIILIAGKGAENYIDEKGEKKYYSDYDEIEKLRG